MTDAAKSDEIPVRVVSVDTTRTMRNTKPGDIAEVIFQVGRDEQNCRLAIQLSRVRFDDGDIVPVARHFLYELVENLSGQLSAWEMSKEEYNRRLLPEEAASRKTGA